MYIIYCVIMGAFFTVTRTFYYLFNKYIIRSYIMNIVMFLLIGMVLVILDLALLPLSLIIFLLFHERSAKMTKLAHKYTRICTSLGLCSSSTLVT